MIKILETSGKFVSLKKWEPWFKPAFIFVLVSQTRDSQFNFQPWQRDMPLRIVMHKSQKRADDDESTLALKPIVQTHTKPETVYYWPQKMNLYPIKTTKTDLNFQTYSQTNQLHTLYQRSIPITVKFNHILIILAESDPM